MFLFQKLSWQLIKLIIRLQFPKVPQLSTKDLANWLQKDGASKLLLLDARTREEYEVSHLQNARLVRNIIKDLSEPKKENVDIPIVVYCSVGYRSCQVVRELQSIGYQKVFNLSGSIFQWVNENRLVYQENQPVDRVHPYHKFWQYLLLK